MVTEEAGKVRGGKKFTLLIRSGYWTGSQLTDSHTCPARFERRNREVRGEKREETKPNKWNENDWSAAAFKGTKRDRLSDLR